jgi:hypothetical protein
MGGCLNTASAGREILSDFCYAALAKAKILAPSGLGIGFPTGVILHNKFIEVVVSCTASSKRR